MIQARFAVDFADFSLDVDLSLPAQGFTVIIGTSGSGKSTLLRCIAGLQSSQTSYLQIGTQTWADSQHQLCLPPHQRAVGYVSQHANLFPHLSVADNINYGCKRLPSPPSAIKLQALIERLGIAHLMNRTPITLSGGEQQRVAIARALALEPEILLMDEPLSALDWQRKDEILPYLQDLQHHLAIPILYVTHSWQEMAQLADHVVVLDQGRQIANGSLNAILHHPQCHRTAHDIFSVWNVKVQAHDPIFALTQVQADGGELWLPQLDRPIGCELRLQLYARDISICLNQPATTSILNILPAQIEHIQDLNPGQCLIHLRLGSEPLWAQITRRSCHGLSLQPGQAVYVQIKSCSVLSAHSAMI